MLGIQQETRQTCLLSLWNSRGKADIKQIIVRMKSVFKKAECGGRQGYYTPGDNLGVQQGQEGLPDVLR